LELITKFIIGTRLVLNHRVKANLLGDLGKQIKDSWVQHKIALLDCSSNWLQDMITGKELQLRFITSLMRTCGTIHDFISAVQSMDNKESQLANARLFSEDWDSFFGIVKKLLLVRSQVKDTISAQMNGLLSILQEISAPLPKSSFPSKDVSSSSDQYVSTEFDAMETVSGRRVPAEAYVAEISQPPCTMPMRYIEPNEDVSRPQFARHCCSHCWPIYQASVNYPLINNQFIPKNLAPSWNPTSEKYHHWVQPHVNEDGNAFFHVPSLTSYDIDSLSNDNFRKIQRRLGMSINKQSMHREIQSLKKLSTYSPKSHSAYFEEIYNFNVWAEQNGKRLQDLWIHNNLGR